MTTRTKTATAPPLDGWKQRGLHTVTCPSGQRLRIRIPGIATLLEHGDLPGDLVSVALSEIEHERGAAGALADSMTADEPVDAKLERVARFASFQRHLVKHAVAQVETGGGWHNVELSDDDVSELPEDDLAMVAEIVQRLRVFDARGVRIGVEPLDRWAAFREVHGCGEDCESCQALVQSLSSTGVVSV